MYARVALRVLYVYIEFVHYKLLFKIGPKIRPCGSIDFLVNYTNFGQINNGQIINLHIQIGLCGIASKQL